MIKITLNIDSNLDSFSIVDFISEKCNQEGLKFTINIDDINNDIQVNEIRERLSKPILIGEKIGIKVLTARNKYFKILDKYELPDKIVVTIEPGTSFGDGTHPTTRMCIEMIEKYIQPDTKVLDVGCGSGILSIISLLLGANHADAIDNSGTAVACARNNAELNNVLDRFTVVKGNLTDSLEGKYDLIVANMLTDSLKVLLADLKKYAHSDTNIILSGIVDFRENEIEDITENNFEIIEKLTSESWSCYVLKLK